MLTLDRSRRMSVGKDPGGYSLSCFFAPFKRIIDHSAMAHAPWSDINVHAEGTTKNVPFLC